MGVWQAEKRACASGARRGHTDDLVPPRERSAKAHARPPVTPIT
jgi:hypothetical protein